MPTTKKTSQESPKKEKKTTVEPTAPAAATQKGKYFYATGKRKTSVAKVRLYKGTGNITINDRPISKYFTVKTLIGLIKSPFVLTGTSQKFDVVVKADGGGITSQAEAIRHGISKALIVSDPLSKPSLKKAGMVTRDSRIKERKKPGLKRARKGPQFSKR
ncbi:MAG: 30S ribosomal protein S9 [Candidatus Gracilibacteria bacterium]|jgi:small subunit ribosomal protein S9